MILERERLFVIGDDNVIDVDRLAHESAGFRVLPAAFVEIRRDARAQILGLADVNDFALGVLVEVDAGGRGQAANFLGEIQNI